MSAQHRLSGGAQRTTSPCSSSLQDCHLPQHPSPTPRCVLVESHLHCCDTSKSHQTGILPERGKWEVICSICLCIRFASVLLHMVDDEGGKSVWSPESSWPRGGLCSAAPQSRQGHNNASEEQQNTTLFKQIGWRTPAEPNVGIGLSI